MSDETVIRAFVAVEISDEVRAGLGEAQDRLSDPELKVKWVEPHNMHLTLLFLGDIFERKALQFADRLERIAGRAAPFRYDVTGVGFFGSRRAPRTVWAGTSSPPELIDLHMRVSGAAENMGYSVEQRKFKGHITLGRVRSSRGTDQLVARAAEMSGIQFGRVFVDSVLFIKSRLTPAGPIYTVMRRALLGKKGE